MSVGWALVVVAALATVLAAVIVDAQQMIPATVQDIALQGHLSNGTKLGDCGSLESFEKILRI
jgi:hypothetical protein